VEKLMYPVWKDQAQSGNEFRDTLRSGLCSGLLEAGVRKLQFNVVDDDVAPANGLRIEATRPAFDGLVSLWVDSAVYRQPLEEIIARHCSHYAGYLVTESEPIVNTRYRAPVGERTEGMAQVVFLQKPSRLDFQDWIDIWHGSHTQIAIDTQSTFGYRQNVIVRTMTYGAAVYDAIIEELFPPEAMSDPNAFYAAGDDDKLREDRQRIMIESCARFIDFDKIDCIPTSEYIMK
jgi:hypothetical protein